MTNCALEPSWTIPSPGETIAGKYVIDGLCGRGGLAVVLSAMHAGLGQRVAVKMLLQEWSGDDEVVRRFVREGRAVTRIKSEHVVRVFDVGTLETGAPYLVLEYLEGHDLDEVLSMWGPLPIPTAIDWVLQAVEAIAEAHAYGIVHRDLKPANLFLTQRADGSACIKVLDFGLSKVTDPGMCGASAKLTRPTDVMGSPHYMAPEQLRASSQADARADLWALGAVLHELLTKQPPFQGETMPQICATVLTQPPPRLSTLRENVAPELERAVLRCLQKDPNERFATAAELARALSPFGSEVARRSCERIERVVETGGRASELTPLPAGPCSEARPSWPSEANIRPLASASPRMIFGSVLILAGLGTGAFLWMYASVHAGDPRGTRVEANTRQPVPPATLATPGPPPVAPHAPPRLAASVGGPPPPPDVALAPPTVLPPVQTNALAATSRSAPTSRPAAPTSRAPVLRGPRLGRAAVVAATTADVVSQKAAPDPRPTAKPASPNDEAPSDDVFDGRK